MTIRGPGSQTITQDQDDDNAFSESQLKTLEYQPDYPDPPSRA